MIFAEREGSNPLTANGGGCCNMCAPPLVRFSSRVDGRCRSDSAISSKKESPALSTGRQTSWKKTHVLGVAVSAINMDDATAMIEHWIEQRTPNYVCITGVHGVMESRKDCRLCDIHNQAGLVTPDGMPLVWMSRWLGAPRIERVY